MKKLLLVLLFSFIALFSFSQEWSEIPEFTDFLWDEYDLDIETYFEEESNYLGFVDYEIQDSVFMSRQISYLLSSIEDYLWYEYDILFEDSNIEGIVYLVTVQKDYFSKNGTEEIDIEIDREWMITYYTSSSRRRNSMLLELIDEYF